MQKLAEKLADKINLFEQSIKSEYTRRVYTTCLNKYLEYVGVKKLGSDPRKIEDNIINFVISMKKQGKSFAAINN
jgi:hypothetical protein